MFVKGSNDIGYDLYINGSHNLVAIRNLLPTIAKAKHSHYETTFTFTRSRF